MSKNIFYIADTHFGHENAIVFDNRPFYSAKDMNKYMITLWNETVPEDADVYIVGDFAMRISAGESKKILDQLNGRKHLIKGNHDIDKYIDFSCFESVQDYLEIIDTVEKNNEIIPCRVILSHYFMPNYHWNSSNTFMLHGHSHISEEYELEEKIKEEIRNLGKRCEIYNVGCMHQDYKPQTIEEIIGRQKHEVDFPIKS